MEKLPDEVKPVTLIPAPYPIKGRWLALPCRPWDVPSAIYGDDNEAYAWYEHSGLATFDGRYGEVVAKLPVGQAEAPSEALADLITQLRALVHIDGRDATLDGRFMWIDEITWTDGKATRVMLSHPGVNQTVGAGEVRTSIAPTTTGLPGSEQDLHARRSVPTGHSAAERSLALAALSNWT